MPINMLQRLPVLDEKEVVFYFLQVRTPPIVIAISALTGNHFQSDECDKETILNANRVKLIWFTFPLVKSVVKFNKLGQLQIDYKWKTKTLHN